MLNKFSSTVLPMMFLIPVLMFGQTFTKITDPANPVVTDAYESGSGSWIDVNGDGYLDLYVANGNLSSVDNSLYMNNRHGGFFKVTNGDMVNDGGSSIGSAWGDYNRDGKLDLFVTNRNNFGNFLYRGAGDTNFTKITTGGPVTDIANSNSSSWVDADNDGNLDLYVINFQGNDYFYRNSGSPSYSLTRIDTLQQVGDGANFSISGSWADVNNDGKIDFFAGNAGTQSDLLYLNNGNLSFTKTVLADGRASVGNSWGDFDNDGNIDLVVTNTLGQNNILYHNGGPPNYALTPVSSSIVSNDGGNSVGSAWGDVDNDGDLDLFVANDGGNNFLYLNDGPPNYTFTKVTLGVVVNDGGNSFGAVAGDYDNDGFLDLFVANRLNQQNFLYHNDRNSNHWIELLLGGTISNPTAIGARVHVKATINGVARWQMRDVQPQSGYNSQNLNLHVGLGDATLIDSLVIQWPSGAQQTFVNIAADRILRVAELDSSAVGLAQPPNNFINDSPSILLAWNAGLYGAPYIVQVSTDSLFQSGVVLNDSTVSDTSALLTVASNNSEYYWRVRPAWSIYSGVWSATWHFSNQVVAPGAPGLISPANGLAGQPIDLSLTWHTAPRGTLYHVQLSSDSLFASIVLDDSTLSDTVRSSGGGLSNQTLYYWRVSSRNIAGTGPLSQVFNFTTIVDTPGIPLLQSPPDAGLHQPVSPVLQWTPVAGASTYRLDVSPDSTFATNTISSIDTTASRQVGPLGHNRKYFWRAKASNAGGTSAYSGVRRFTTMFGIPDLISPANGSTQSFSTILRWSSVSGAIQYRVQISADSTLTSTFGDESLSDTILSVSGLLAASTYYWRVRGMDQDTAGSWSDIRHFAVNVATAELHTAPGWNMISLPVEPLSAQKDSLFPSSVSPAYRYSPETGYILSDTLHPGTGYWLKFSQSQSIVISGVPAQSETLAVRPGWNLIGPPHDSIQAASIASDPPGLVSSQIFGYGTKYVVVEELLAGHAYWVKLQDSGKLIFNNASSNNRLRIVPGTDLPPASPGTSAPESAPAAFEMNRAFPNPFNPSTRFTIDIPKSSEVIVSVYNIAGTLVATLMRGSLNAGAYTLEWNGNDSQGRSSATGIYFIRVAAGGFEDVQKVLLVR
ncbi:MAG TPA: FG-GAP-like repeat-containing protein [Bacteroidota bacterium]|jgi:hypothetical protein|nr:FG-GAP-like repeat-containing protein [Bacteroidota bacterium]